MEEPARSYDSRFIGSTSRYLCLLLRHKPEAAGITLNPQGWTNVNLLITQVCATGRHLDRDMLDFIVDTDEKGRYSYKTFLRANREHIRPDTDPTLDPLEVILRGKQDPPEEDAEPVYDPALIESMTLRLDRLLRRPDEALAPLFDEEGWIDARLLVEAFCENGELLDFGMLDHILALDGGNRFLCRTFIRANQGHSLPWIDVRPTRLDPPEVLYHGTVAKTYDMAIKQQGLSKMKRNHVHLSANEQTAVQVSLRRRKTGVLLLIDSARMAKDGYVFYRSDNGVWLTDSVPPQYITYLRTLTYERPQKTVKNTEG